MNRLKLLVLLLLLPLVIACATLKTRTDSQEVSAHYKRGIAYLSEDRIQQAFVEFQKAYKLNPKDKEVLNAIGVIYLLHFDNLLKAIEYFEKAIEAAPDYSEAYNNLGKAHDKSGHLETAISFYKKAVSNLTYRTPEKAYINMGNSYYRLGRYESAIDSFQEAIKRSRHLSLPYLRLALCYNAVGRYGDASTAITQAITLDPVYNGNREKAIEDFTLLRLKATGYVEQDLRDYLEILKY